MIKNLITKFSRTFLTFFSSLVFFLPENALAFPIYAQQA